MEITHGLIRITKFKIVNMFRHMYMVIEKNFTPVTTERLRQGSGHPECLTALQ